MKPRTRTKANDCAPTSANVTHLLVILARVTRRIVDEEQARPKTEQR